jgi:hypothetical protein
VAEGTAPPEVAVREQGAIVSTQQIIWTVVFVVAALAVIGFIVASMRKKNQQENRARAAEIRESAEAGAAVIPDAQARARETEAQAEQARLQAERAEERARAARTEAAQQEALHEDQVRAADRLDPDVDHKADDYTPETVTPEPASTGTHAGERSTHDPETIFDSRDSDTTADTTAGTTAGTTADTVDTTPGTGTHRSATTEPDWTDPEQRGGTSTPGGSHRA